jgi:Uma2 family endonuclease
MRAPEFLALPESSLPTELIGGEVMMSPAPELKHQEVVLQLGVFLKQAAPNGVTYVSPTDVYLDEDNVVQPDVLWLAPGSECVPVEGKYLRGAPDLVIEVLSPGTTRMDKVDKFRLYEKHGAREYWIVEPAESYVEVWSLAEGRFAHRGVYGADESFVSAVLGVSVDLKQVMPSEAG